MHWKPIEDTFHFVIFIKVVIIVIRIIMIVMCQEFAVPNCIEGATYDPWKSLGETTTAHNYREGNLPPNSKFVNDNDDDDDDNYAYDDNDDNNDCS